MGAVPANARRPAAVLNRVGSSPTSASTLAASTGVRLDSGKPGTGLGLAIVRDVAEIYEGTVSLEESDDLGGLLGRLRLPAAT